MSATDAGSLLPLSRSEAGVGGIIPPRRQWYRRWRPLAAVGAATVLVGLAVLAWTGMAPQQPSSGPQRGSRGPAVDLSSLQCAGFNIGKTKGGASVISQGVAHSFTTVDWNAFSTEFWVESLDTDIPFNITIGAVPGANPAECTPRLDITNYTATATPRVFVGTYSCSHIGESKLRATLTMGGACGSLPPVNFYLFKTHGSALRLGTEPGKADIVDDGVTAASWQQASDHFYYAGTNQLVLYAAVANGAQNQPFDKEKSVVTHTSTHEGIASPQLNKFPTTITNQTQQFTITFVCRASGHVDVSVKLVFQPWAPSTFRFSFHCMYIADLSATLLTSVNKDPVIEGGVTLPGWNHPANVRGVSVSYDEILFTNTGPSFDIAPVVASQTPFYGTSTCQVSTTGNLTAGGSFPAQSTRTLRIAYHCPANSVGAWSKVTIPLHPVVALASQLQWQKVSGARTGFHVHLVQTNASVVRDGVVETTFLSHGSDRAAAITVPPDVWSTTFTFQQLGAYPAFTLLREPLVSALGLYPYPTQGIIPIPQGKVALTRSVGRTSTDLNIIYWSKLNLQESVVHVSLDMPMFEQVTFAFNKQVQWMTELSLSMAGFPVNADGEPQAEWGPAGVDAMKRFEMTTLSEEFTLVYSGTTSVKVGEVQMMTNWTTEPGPCNPSLSGDYQGGSVTPLQALTVKVTFNCSNTVGTTLFTFVVPIEGKSAKGITYTPIMFQFLYDSYPAYPTRPVITAASASSEAAAFTFTTDVRGLQLTGAFMRQYVCGHTHFVESAVEASPSGALGSYGVSVDNLLNKHPYQFSIEVFNVKGGSGFSELSPCVTPLYSFKLVITLSIVGGVIVLFGCGCYWYNKGCGCLGKCCATIFPCCKCRCRCCRTRKRPAGGSPAAPHTGFTSTPSGKKKTKKKKKKKKRAEDRERRRRRRRDHGGEVGQSAMATPLLSEERASPDRRGSPEEEIIVPLTAELSYHSFCEREGGSGEDKRGAEDMSG